MTIQRMVMSLAVLAALGGGTARAGSVSGLTTFTAGTPAKASEVNGNFSAVKTAVDDNASRIAALESAVAALKTTVTALQGDLATANSTIASLQGSVTTLQTSLATTQSDLATAKSNIATLQAQVVTINASDVMALEPYLAVTPGGTPKALLSGINLQIVNGAASTNSVNGTGNLIIGYDEVRADLTYFCSNGNYGDQATCTANGGTWAVSHKTGSHYLVMGHENNYSQYGGIVAGYRNTATNSLASVTGGSYGTSRGYLSSVSGGYLNIASGSHSSVTGGYYGTASGGDASVTGGYLNTASGRYSSVSGGASNTASGANSSVTGGYNGTASGFYGSSVSGGLYNTASGSYAHVSGGGNGTAAGGNTAATNYSSILGGVGQTTTSASQTIPALP